MHRGKQSARKKAKTKKKHRAICVVTEENGQHGEGSTAGRRQEEPPQKAQKAQKAQKGGSGPQGKQPAAAGKIGGGNGGRAARIRACERMFDWLRGIGAEGLDNMQVPIPHRPHPPTRAQTQSERPQRVS